MEGTNSTNRTENNTNTNPINVPSTLQTGGDALAQVTSPRFQQGEAGAPPPSLEGRVSLPPKIASKITSEEVDQIILYVRNHPELLVASSEKLTYVKKGEGLPRTIAVRTEQDELKLYIFLKRKLADGSNLTGAPEKGAVKQKKDIALLKGGALTAKAELLPKEKQVSEKNRENLNREIQFLSLCKGVSHVAQLEDVLELDGRPHLIEDEYTGGDLDKAMRNLSEEKRHVVIGDILEGVKGVHEKGIRHSDIKPANIILDEEGRAYVADFDRANRVENHAGLVGSLMYISPELFQAELTDDDVLRSSIKFESDDFATGIIMLQTLMGDPLGSWNTDVYDVCITSLKGKNDPEALSDDDIDLLMSWKIIQGDTKEAWPEQIVTSFTNTPATKLYEREFQDFFRPGETIEPELQIAKDLMEPDRKDRITVKEASERWDQLHPRPKS